MNRKYEGELCARCGKHPAVSKGLCHGCYNQASAAKRNGRVLPPYGARRMVGRIVAGWRILGRNADAAGYAIRCQQCGVVRTAHYATLQHLTPHTCACAITALLPWARGNEAGKIRVLAECDGNYTEAAKRCGCTRQYVHQCYRKAQRRRDGQTPLPVSNALLAHTPLQAGEPIATDNAALTGSATPNDYATPDGKAVLANNPSPANTAAPFCKAAYADNAIQSGIVLPTLEAMLADTSAPADTTRSCKAVLADSVKPTNTVTPSCKATLAGDLSPADNLALASTGAAPPRAWPSPAVARAAAQYAAADAP